MGRRKIEIQPITHERNRTVTFLKRKNGLFKKAYELGVLCSVDVAVIVFETRHGHRAKLYEYCSGDVKELIQCRMKHDGEADKRGPADFGGKAADEDGDEDEDEEGLALPPKRRNPPRASKPEHTVEQPSPKEPTSDGSEETSPANNTTRLPDAGQSTAARPPTLPVSSIRHGRSPTPPVPAKRQKRDHSEPPRASSAPTITPASSAIRTSYDFNSPHPSGDASPSFFGPNHAGPSHPFSYSGGGSAVGAQRGIYGMSSPARDSDMFGFLQQGVRHGAAAPFEWPMHHRAPNDMDHHPPTSNPGWFDLLSSRPGPGTSWERTGPGPDSHSGTFVDLMNAMDFSGSVRNR